MTPITIICGDLPLNLELREGQLFMRTKNGLECVDYTFDHENLTVRQDMKVSELAEIVRRIGENWWDPGYSHHVKAQEINERFR